MAKKTQSKKTEPDAKQLPVENMPGASLSHFRVAVQAITALVNESEFLVFFGRASRARLIGDFVAFKERFFVLAKDPRPTENDARKCFKEISYFLNIYISIPNMESRLQFLTEQAYRGQRNDSEAVSAELLEFLTAKIQIVAEQAFSKPLLRRFDRLSTAVTPCVEDIDIELISERQDQFKERHIKQPFLRLRFRYSDNTTSYFPFFYPWNIESSSSVQTDSFEIECDELDIDLIIRRLIVAKEVLLRTMITDEYSSLQGADSSSEDQK